MDHTQTAIGAIALLALLRVSLAARCRSFTSNRGGTPSLLRLLASRLVLKADGALGGLDHVGTPRRHLFKRIGV